MKTKMYIGLAVMLCLALAGVAQASLIISVDYVVGPTGGTGSGPGSGDTTLGSGPMQNAVGNIFTGQVGAWNALNIGTYNNSSASTGFLLDGSGNPTTVKLLLGQATGLPNWGDWRCTPNEASANSINALRSEEAYLYNGVVTGDHYVWALTGLQPSAPYVLTFFGGGGNTTGASNIGNGVSGIRDSEGDWNWTAINSDALGTISGTFTAPFPTLGIQGMQLELIPEPGTLSLMLTAGLGGLLGWRRRRRD